MTTKTTPAVAKKDIQKLQRVIIDGLEDVKAQDIKVFDTERLSALFERVIIASGTSNRQTKALAASVRDAVRDAGFPKPRVEGETNGEWIIVDCGQAVVHVMQPNFRQYYNLEELWGEKPVRLKFGAAKPEIPEVVKPVKATKAVAKPVTDLKRASAAKKGVAEAFPSKAQLKKTLAAESAAAKAPAKRAVARKTTVKAPVAGANPSPTATKTVAQVGRVSDSVTRHLSNPDVGLRPGLTRPTGGAEQLRKTKVKSPVIVANSSLAATKKVVVAAKKAPAKTAAKPAARKTPAKKAAARKA